MKSWLLLFCVVITPAFGQDLNAPITKLVPITQTVETGFMRDTIRRLWNISPVKPYHKAGVKVSCPNGNAGSGGIIRTVDDKAFVVITNHHVIEGNEGNFVTILAHGGSRTDAKVVWWDKEADVAVLINTTRGVKNGFPIYNGKIPIGSTVEVVAFGGPGRMVPEEDLRPFTGKVIRTSYSSAICIDAYTVSGDSGSSILYDGAVVGVNWGHYDYPSVQIEGWSAGKPMASHVDGPWLARTLTQVCQPYGCAPVIRQPRDRIIFSPGNPILPVAPTEQPMDIEPPIDSEPSAYLDQAGIDEIVKQVLAHPSLQPDKLRGPEGPPGMDGQAGANGKDGLDGKDGTVSQEQMNQIIQQVTDELAAQYKNLPQPPTLEEITSAVLAQVPPCKCEESNSNGDVSVGTPDANSPYLESNRVLYFTANTCANCFETTNMVNSLKRSGYPITIITLTTSMAEANQVPQVFVPATGERAMGPSQVKKFLSSISL